MPKRICEERIALFSQLGELAERHTGRTTRLVDKYIQDLYDNQGEWIEIHDHDFTNNNKQEDYLVLNMIERRLSFEHKSDVFEIDKPKCRIRLVRCSRDSICEEIDRIGNELDGIERNYQFLT